jgi:hypothetical protein
VVSILLVRLRLWVVDLRFLRLMLLNDLRVVSVRVNDMIFLFKPAPLSVVRKPAPLKSAVPNPISLVITSVRIQDRASETEAKAWNTG